MMKQWAAVFVLLLSPLMVATAAGDGWVCKRVLDGDTIQAEGYGIEVTIRLVGIDAPETGRRKHDEGQPFSQVSKKALSSKVLNRPLILKGYGTGGYNRPLCEVFADGVNVNLLMVEKGLAEVYQGKPPRGFNVKPYLDAQKQAQGKGKGIWGLGDAYVSPAVWRKRK